MLCRMHLSVCCACSMYPRCVISHSTPPCVSVPHSRQILFWKKRAEEALQRSGLPHTIVRPGGLKSKLGPGETSAGNIVMGRAGSYGFPPLQKSGAILRSQVCGFGVLLIAEPVRVCRLHIHTLWCICYTIKDCAADTASEMLTNAFLLSSFCLLPPTPCPSNQHTKQVADVCVEALVCRAAEGKVVEIIAEKEAPAAGSIEALFEGVSMTWP